MSLLDIFKKRKSKKEKSRELSYKEKQRSSSRAQEKPLKASNRSDKPGVARIDQGAEGGERYAHLIARPRITEKASFITSDGAYTFDVSPRANKSEIKKAIREIYKVNPIKVNVINMKPKRVMVRNRPGTRGGGKKAVVYLKEGERIEFV